MRPVVWGLPRALLGSLGLPAHRLVQGQQAWPLRLLEPLVEGLGLCPSPRALEAPVRPVLRPQLRGSRLPLALAPRPKSSALPGWTVNLLVPSRQDRAPAVRLEPGSMAAALVVASPALLQERPVVQRGRLPAPLGLLVWDRAPELA